MKRFIRNTKILLVSCAVLLFSGCAEHSLRVTPELPINSSQPSRIMCNVIYDESNKEYLPSTLTHDPNSPLEAHYTYSVHYVNGSTDWDGLNLWNPLLIVGFPMSQENVIVEGKLEFKDKENTLQHFSASCIAEKTRSLFQTGGSSGPRKACLLAVRDTINQQLHQFNKGVKSE